MITLHFALALDLHLAINWLAIPIPTLAIAIAITITLARPGVIVRGIGDQHSPPSSSGIVQHRG